MERPTGAGIYDYLLGGSHNTPVEGQIAEDFRGKLPHMVQWMYYNRYFLFDAIEQFTAAGFEHFIDLGTGFPIESKEESDATYPHTGLPPTAKIVYNDINPAVVAKSQVLLGDRPNVVYVEADVRQIDTILTAAESLFGDERRVAISFTGLIYFLDDAAIQQIFQQLHEWAGPGSRIAVTTFEVNRNDPNYQAMADLYAQVVREPVYPRNPAELLALVGPWQGQLARIEEYVPQRMGRTPNIPEVPGQAAYVGILER